MMQLKRSLIKFHRILHTFVILTYIFVIRKIFYVKKIKKKSLSIYLLPSVTSPNVLSNPVYRGVSSTTVIFLVEIFRKKIICYSYDMIMKEIQCVFTSCSGG